MAEKFVLLADFGMITVGGYSHGTRLALFRKKYETQFCCYDKDIEEKNLRNPSRLLRSGDTLHVRAFKQSFFGTTTFEERVAFLKSQKAMFVGAEGVSLLWEEKRHQLPKGYGYGSFDEKDRLWTDNAGYHRVPVVRCNKDKNESFDFMLGYAEMAWFCDSIILCFCEAE